MDFEMLWPPLSSSVSIASAHKRSLVVPHMGIHSASLVLGSYVRMLPSKISPLAKQMNSPLGSLVQNCEGGIVSPNSMTCPCM